LLFDVQQQALTALRVQSTPFFAGYRAKTNGLHGEAIVSGEKIRRTY